MNQKKISFDDATIESLFGAEDAENETESRFKEYFVKNKAYSNISADLSIRIAVGHKGVGKSAVLKRAYLDDTEQNKLSVWIQPNDISSLESSSSISFNERIEIWKVGILKIIADKALDKIFQQKIIIPGEDEENLLKRPINTILSIFRKNMETYSDQVAEQTLHNFYENEVITVYIDDIDRGWSASTSDIQSISALLNAVRDLAGTDSRLRFRLGLRSDVYFLVRTSDESTDKIERHVVWVEWTNNEILQVIAKRIETFFDPTKDTSYIQSMKQQDISKQILSKIIEPRFQGRGHWSNRYIHHVLLSLCRRRPRDLIKLLHSASRNAYKNDHDIITSNDLESAFEPYSSERLQDLVNEFKSEIPEIESLLLSMRPTKKGRRTAEGFQFTNDSMTVKLRDVIQQTNLTFRNRRPVNPKSLLHFLYKIDFVTARKQMESGEIDRKYFDQSRFLANSVVDFGYNWEIHPAYRWALSPQSIDDVFDSLRD